MTDIALSPCPFCGWNAEIVSGGPGNHFVQCVGCRATSDDLHLDTAIAAWNRRTSPSQAAPANPTQVVSEAMVEALKPFAAIADTISPGVADKHIIEGAWAGGVFESVRVGDFRRAKAALTATIGAGGQAVAYDPCGGCGEKNPDKRCIGCLHPFSTLSQPHPTDERVVEALPRPDAVAMTCGTICLEYLDRDERDLAYDWLEAHGAGAAKEGR